MVVALASNFLLKALTKQKNNKRNKNYVLSVRHNKSLCPIISGRQWIRDNFYQIPMYVDYERKISNPVSSTSAQSSEKGSPLCCDIEYESSYVIRTVN